MSAKQSLSGLRILLTNDDGIDSPGLKALERIAHSITPDVWVIAPDMEQSGKGFSVTFDSILKIDEISPRKFTVSGTPSDCVYMAIGEILKDKLPDLVLSGINIGANIGDYIGMSGTVGAAFAAASRNIKAIALSQHYEKPQYPTKFPLIDHFLPTIIKKLLSFTWPDRICMNVNFPEAQVGEISGIKSATQGKLDVVWKVHKKMDPIDRSYYWLQGVHTVSDGNEDSDVALLEQKKAITITALQNRHEFRECSGKLEELFASHV
ncbi:MAG: 5'/3'-nucleotidase SurE [Holosporaceae bacterium]|jgi:5'-nucleotidase|nr:5'/3'-nucleotidase SurE [Holosporaceae bacterium]